MWPNSNYHTLKCCFKTPSIQMITQKRVNSLKQLTFHVIKLYHQHTQKRKLSGDSIGSCFWSILIHFLCLKTSKSPSTTQRKAVLETPDQLSTFCVLSRANTKTMTYNVCTYMFLYNDSSYCEPCAWLDIFLSFCKSHVRASVLNHAQFVMVLQIVTDWKAFIYNHFFLLLSVF